MGNETDLEREVLERLGRLPHGRGNFKQLVRELGTRGTRRQDLEDALERLAAQGRLIEVRGGHYTLPERTREYAVGRLIQHRDGYAFVAPETPPPGVRGDLFIPAGQAGAAMHGDRVLARIAPVAGDGRAEGAVVKVLRRAHPSVVGEFRVGRHGNFVIPHESRIRQTIAIPPGMEGAGGAANPDRIAARAYAVRSAEDLNGMIVNVEITRYPEEGGGATGRVVEILGNPDDFGVDVEVTIRKHHLPHRFPAEVLEQAQSIPGVIPPEEIARRRDFRHLPAITIDGETARDFDDAVWVEALAGGSFALHVHIADVSHYVQPGSAIDREALARGTSVYFPDRAVPMLPLELSTEICSLKPQVDRLALSALLEIDRQGSIVAQHLCRSVIRSAERMTYTGVHLILEGDEGWRARYAALAPMLDRMKELALILNRKRVQRGSIDFDLPEPLIRFDENGVMVGIERTPRTIAHRLIEEFMLAANEAVASHLEKSGREAIYRVHETPDPARVLEFEEMASRFGHSLGMGAMPVKRFPAVMPTGGGRKPRRDLVRADERFRITSQLYQRLVARLEGKPEERILSYLMLRSLKQARYSAENTGHFALASGCYTHFTSPIRRYPDLVVHRLLGELLDVGEPGQASLAPVAEQCSFTERRAAEAERELLEWKKVKFMIEHVGDEFAALIISTTRFGFFVELDDWFVEGLAPIETLPGERYTWQENTRQIVGERSRRVFRIGDRLRVRLDRVDGVEKKLQFSVVEPEPFRKKKGSR
jgi:ribonuclease R